MKLPIISPRQRIERIEYFREFRHVAPDGSLASYGFSFPSDARGRVDVAALNPIARGSWDDVQAGCIAGAYVDVGIAESRSRYVEPAVARCYCGREVFLSDPLENACDCGRLYNMGGQLLAPRAQWEYPEREFSLHNEDDC